MFLTLALAATLCATPDSSADLRTFRAIINDFEAAFNTRDAARFVKHFATDGDFMQAFGRYRGDRAATLEFMTRFFSLQPPEFRAVERGTRVRCITPDVALVEVEISGDGIRNEDGSPQPPRRGQMMLTLRRARATWEVAAYRYLDIHDGTLRRSP
jgi:uncharacterized protein (TIGR02246 family)